VQESGKQKGREVSPSHFISILALQSCFPVDRHLAVVSLCFRIAGFVLAVPSVAMLVFGIWLWASTPPHATPDVRYTNVQTYGLIGMLQGGASLLGKAMNSLGAASRFFAEILITLAVFVMALSTSVFLTGRGLVHHAGWARISGFLLAGLVLAGSILAPRTAILLIPASIYVLWVLGWRYS
jgi:hypothetical protein